MGFFGEKESCRGGERCPSPLLSFCLPAAMSGARLHRWTRARKGDMHMKAYRLIILREHPVWKEAAARWFHARWGIPLEAYRESIEASLAEGVAVLVSLPGRAKDRGRHGGHRE